jgi:2'-hydroxyisoflavone reductase
VHTYLFISTISVYGDPLSPHADEQAPLATLDDPTIEQVTGESYGGLKVLCERAVSEIYGERALIIRPGLIVGPYDPTDRFTYWPVRVARGGAVLAPGDGSRPVQFIDVRDLGTWIVDCLEDRVRGTYNATGPAEPLTFGRLLRACREVTGSDATFTWVDDRFLVEKDVRPYAELPLWIPGEDGLAFGTVQITRALEDGLQIRPLRETVTDTWRWAAERDTTYTWRAGMDAEREARLLRRWNELSAES